MNNKDFELSPEEVKESIKKNIVELRKSNKMKMREVAAALSMNENTYRIWEDPKRSCPKPYDIVKLARVYDVSCDFILGNSDSPQNYFVKNESNYNGKKEKLYLSSLDSYEKLLVMSVRRLSLEEKAKINEEIHKMLEGK